MLSFFFAVIGICLYPLSYEVLGSDVEADFGFFYSKEELLTLL